MSPTSSQNPESLAYRDMPGTRWHGPWDFPRNPGACLPWIPRIESGISGAGGISRISWEVPKRQQTSKKYTSYPLNNQHHLLRSWLTDVSSQLVLSLNYLLRRWLTDLVNQPFISVLPASRVVNRRFVIRISSNHIIRNATHDAYVSISVYPLQ